MPARDSAGSRGQAAEERARLHLEAQGLITLARNFRCRQGEIDLVMAEGNTIVFVEVRFRAHSRYGGAAESVDSRKQARIAAAAQYFLMRTPALSKRPCRFDVVAMTKDSGKPDWIRNAFDLD